MKELFGQPYDESDPTWVAKCYFDIIYNDGFFLKAIGYIIEKNSFFVDGAYCNFPDINSYFEEEHFEGVEFAFGYPPTEKDTILVSEEICFKYVRLACEKYLQLHPEDMEKINELLDKII